MPSNDRLIASLRLQALAFSSLDLCDERVRRQSTKRRASVGQLDGARARSAWDEAIGNRGVPARVAAGVLLVVEGVRNCVGSRSVER